MEMNKNQLAMAVIGGAGAVIALAVFALVWMNSAEVEELNAKVAEERSSCAAKRGVTRKCGNEIKEVTTRLAEDAAGTYAALTNGFLIAEVPERTALQKLMNAAYERYKKLPVDATTKIIKEDFTFGPFGDYIKGTIPNEKETPLLARRWGDVSELTDLLVEAGATGLTDVKILTKKTEEESVNARGRNARGRNARNNKNPEADDTAYACSEETYELTFFARPAALVKFMNSLSASKRFFTLDSVKFEQAGDPLLQAIGADSKEDSRKSKEETEEERELGRNKICVTDPATTAPLTVTVKVTAMIFAEKKEAK